MAEDRRAAARSRSSGCPRRRRCRSAAPCVSTWTLASSQATNSPFIQMRSACVHVLLLLQVREHRLGRLGGASPSRRGPRVRSPRSRARSTADSRAARLGSPSRVRGAASARPRGTSPAGWRCPGPAMSGAEPWTGSNRPGPSPPERGAREHPERAGEHRRLVAEDVAEHVLGEDHVEVARARRRAASRRCRRAGARARRRGTPRRARGARPRATAGWSRARWPCRRSSPCVRAAPNAMRAMRSISRDGVDADVVRAVVGARLRRRSRCRR